MQTWGEGRDEERETNEKCNFSKSMDLSKAIGSRLKLCFKLQYISLTVLELDSKSSYTHADLSAEVKSV